MSCNAFGMPRNSTQMGDAAIFRLAGNRYTLCVNRFVRGSFAFGEIDLRCAGLRISYEWSRLGGGIAMAEDKEPFEALTVLDCSSCKMRCIGCGITF
jgi:hypothetical protein